MPSEINWGIIAPFVLTVLNIVIGVNLLADRRGKRASDSAKLEVELQYIKTGIADIQKDIKSMNATNSDIIGRLIRLESRQEELEKRLHALEIGGGSNG